jgi:hypothetical protein
MECVMRLKKMQEACVSIQYHSGVRCYVSEASDKSTRKKDRHMMTYMSELYD